MVTHPRRGSRGSSVTNTGMVNTVARYITGSSAKPAPERLPPATRVCLSLSLSLNLFSSFFSLFSLFLLSLLSIVILSCLYLLPPPLTPSSCLRGMYFTFLISLSLFALPFFFSRLTLSFQWSRPDLREGCFCSSGRPRRSRRFPASQN